MLLLERLPHILTLPRAAQPDALRGLRAELPARAGEPWNSTFGPDSLYHALTRTTVVSGVHTANRGVVAPFLARRPGFRVLEVGGGDGSLWEGLLAPDATGEIVVVDPHPDGAEGVRRHAPAGVHVTHLRAPVEAAPLPEADLVVCSLMLHHLAGADAAERATVGLAGPGKREVLEAFGRAVAPRDGRILLNEADVYCDLGLAPGDPVLLERLVDSYVRRFAYSIMVDLHVRADVDGTIRARWQHIARDWGLGQLEMADAAWDARDVYELDVLSWLRLLDAAGLRVESRRFTDSWLLFHQYVLSPQAAIR